MTVEQAIEVPAIAELVKKVAIGAARWSEKTRQDVQSARIQAQGDDSVFVLRLSARESVIPIFRGVIVSTFLNAERFIRHNPDAPDAIMALSRWALERINKGASRFETRWSPGSEGFFAITAVAGGAAKAS